MEDETYRRILKMKALERWENEGGRITDDVELANRDSSTRVESNTFCGASLHGAGHQRDIELTTEASTA